ncbi:MAG TPA: hypothetical protein PLH75_08470 [Amaricoccus sp.]|uniref:hypothetical protein n=1 Tax=Amaricoccus sp. TaxID=1872485 RepID=UPI001DBEB471|nr:hypothetical protein [Amaricoccus sp.]MCB1373510.1 hypothetical protein [Paracoccaceae bacterium]MCC0066559.1 hypothetical protein [Rhodovulum sp.]HPG22810.1 hypothetical protein [Amaricoccus sp.]HRW15964.1 hypothetical protein [Amaricoccus sp.]
MDPITLAYYGLICGLLGLAAPLWRRPGLRFLIGVLVGLAAAGLLPMLRQGLIAG